MIKPFVVICCLVGASLAAAQERDQDIKFRLAQSYERGGDMQSAAKLYEEVYRKDTTNYTVFDALRRVYLQLRRTPEAIGLVTRRLAAAPNDVGLWAQLGLLHVRNSDEPKAVQAWEHALSIEPKNQMSYILVAGAMVECRLFDKAVAAYLRGRQACASPSLFTNDVAYLYSIMMNYADATKEYVSLVEQNPGQLGYVQSRMAGYTGRAEGLGAATLAVEQSVKAAAGNLPLLQLLAWLYMEGKKFETALDVYRKIDDMTKASGREIYGFAEHALKENVYDIAAKAFQEVITRYPKFDQIPQAKFGYARTLEAAATPADSLRLFGGASPFRANATPSSESEPAFTGVVAAYQRIVSEYPGSEISARSLLRIAVLMQERFFNLDEALASLKNLEEHYAAFPAIAVETKLMLGEVWLAKGELDKSEAAYAAAAADRQASKPQRERAALSLAELDYYRGKFKESIRRLQDLSKDAASDITNDALVLQMFIKDNEASGEAGLKEFSRADFVRRQRRLPEALAMFQTVCESYKGTSLVDEAMMNIGDILTRMERYPEALAAYDTMAKNFPESIDLDRAQMKTAQVYEMGLHDAARAVAAYQALLERYPNSIYTAEARRRVRELRGDNL